MGRGRVRRLVEGMQGNDRRPAAGGRRAGGRRSPPRSQMKQLVVSAMLLAGHTFLTHVHSRGKVEEATKQKEPGCSSPPHCVSLAVLLLASSSAPAPAARASSASGRSWAARRRAAIIVPVGAAA